MGTTGLIYVAIVAAWAAYLVPMLLKRNDEVSRRRSAEMYSSSAARVLSRQTDIQARARYVVRPPSAPGTTDEAVTADPSPPTRYVPNRARRVAAMRHAAGAVDPDPFTVVGDRAGKPGHAALVDRRDPGHADRRLRRSHPGPAPSPGPRARRPGRRTPCPRRGPPRPRPGNRPGVVPGPRDDDRGQAPGRC